MQLFGKKKDEDEEDLQDDGLDIEDEETVEERKLKKQLRDLKRENRKKRKEPTKPWGRRERYLVLAFLITTLLIAGVLAIFSRGFPSLNIQHFNFPKINFDSLNIFKEETIIIYK